MEVDMPASPVPSVNQHPVVGDQDAMDVDKSVKKNGHRHRGPPRAMAAATHKMASLSVKQSKPSPAVTSQKKDHQQPKPGIKNDLKNLVMKAVRNLKDAGGSTARDIKKYLAGKYNVDVKAQSADILLSLKSGVQAGQILKESGKYKAAAKKKGSGKKGKGKKSKKSGGKKSRGKK